MDWETKKSTKESINIFIDEEIQQSQSNRVARDTWKIVSNDFYKLKLKVQKKTRRQEII